MTTKMNPEVKAKWLTALRSGEYVQTKRTLERLESAHEPAGFCCLGVLCKIAADEGVVERTVFDGATVASYSGEQGMPPQAVVNWAGLVDLYRLYPSDALAIGDRATLPDLNDVNGLSFEQIADIIEENL